MLMIYIRFMNTLKISHIFNINFIVFSTLVLAELWLEQMQENLAAVEEGPLTPEAALDCDRVWQKIRGVSPLYNR